MALLALGRLVFRHRHALIGASSATGACLCFQNPIWALEPGLPSASLLPPADTKMVDTVLAGLGLWGGCTALGLLEPLTGLRLFAPPMMASGIIFFAGPQPPHPKGFLSGTLCSATLSLVTLTALTPVLPPVAAQGAAAGVLLMWYKCTGAIFPPAAVLAGALATASVSAASATFSIGRSLSFLAFPWLAGHAFLYGCAIGTSEVRLRARVFMTKRKLRQRPTKNGLLLENMDDAALRAVFERFDTSGDGVLDADELKVGLRVALGVEVTQPEAAELVAAADKDGTGNVDFDEFVAICREQI